MPCEIFRTILDQIVLSDEEQKVRDSLLSHEYARMKKENNLELSGDDRNVGINLLIKQLTADREREVHELSKLTVKKTKEQKDKNS